MLTDPLTLFQLQREAPCAAVWAGLHRRHRPEAAEERPVTFLWRPDGKETYTGGEGAGGVSPLTHSKHHAQLYMYAH